MSLVLTAAVGGAGGIGAVARVVVDGALTARRRPAVPESTPLLARLPLPTLLINVSGSLLLGVLTGLVIWHGAPSALRTTLGTGFCGGFTTFSTAVLHSVRLREDGRTDLAALYALGSLVLSLLAAIAGLALASLG